MNEWPDSYGAVAPLIKHRLGRRVDGIKFIRFYYNMGPFSILCECGFPGDPDPSHFGDILLPFCLNGKRNGTGVRGAANNEHPDKLELFRICARQVLADDLYCFA